jgi:hypothetical protein
MATIEIGEGKFDYTQAKNETMAKNLGREDLTQLFLEFLVARFGEENAGLVDKNTVGFVFGDVNDNDGCPCDMAATVKFVIKNDQDHCGTKKYTPAWDFYEAKRVYAETGKPMGEL